MQFKDQILLRFCDPVSRFTAFTESALKNAVMAAYRVERVALQGTATPMFSSFVLGGLDEPEGDPATNRDASLRVDALWRGSISVDANFAQARVEVAEMATLSLDGFDVEVVTANGGALPIGAALEPARREILAGRIAAISNNTAAATDQVIDSFLAKSGVQNIATLLEKPNQVTLSQLQLMISDPIGGAGFKKMEFPVALAVLIRDPSEPQNSLTELVSAARLIQQQLRKAGFEPQIASQAGGQGTAAVVLVVPESWFEDQDWPGTNKTERIEKAGDWMAREGIGLAVIPN